MKRRATYRDVSIPLNGEHGHRLFRFAEHTGLPVQIHAEIEDGLPPALEEMLAARPRSAHATVAYRAARSPLLVEALEV